MLLCVGCEGWLIGGGGGDECGRSGRVQNERVSEVEVHVAGGGRQHGYSSCRVMRHERRRRRRTRRARRAVVVVVARSVRRQTDHGRRRRLLVLLLASARVLEPHL